MRSLVAAQRRGVGWAVRRREERRERRSPSTREWEVLHRDGSREKITEEAITVELSSAQFTEFRSRVIF